MTLDFDSESLPWLDAWGRELDGYIATVEDDPARRIELREQLVHWTHFGFLVLEKAIEPALIDAYLADLDELFERREHSPLVSTGYDSYQKVKDWEGTDPRAHGIRILDFHNWSVAGKRISLHPSIVRMLGHIFRDEVVAMQSLTFLKGSEQGLHQDYAYVRAEIPSHLAASWVALEDISPDAGPLAYAKCSHTIPKFDWGDGLFRTVNSTGNDDQFSEHIQARLREAGLAPEAFAPKKGDVFLWHGALAHGGMPANDKDLTRRSFVTHYSTGSGYRHDYRAKDREPVREVWNGGVLYRHPEHPDEESAFPRGRDV